MNSESLEIIRKAREEKEAGTIQQWQYNNIVLSVMKAEVDSHIVIYSDGDLYIEPRSVIYIPPFARQL